MKRFSMIMVAVLVITSMLAAACAAPTPETIVETVVVEKEVETIKEVVETVEVEVEKVVEKEVIVTQEVEVEKEVVKEVEVVVTPTPEPAPEQTIIEGFPTEDENEAATAMAAFEAADQGEPDAGVTGCRLDKGAAGRDLAVGFGAPDHAERNAVLDGAAGVEALEPGKQPAGAGLKVLEFDDGRRADGGEHVVERRRGARVQLG